MADISILKPQAGEHTVFEQSEGSRLIFNFPTDQAVMERVGDNLVFSFDDASTITLDKFYTAYTKTTLPEFVVDGQAIAGEQFFAALGEDLQPAAGPAAAPTVAPGAGSSAGFGDASLLGGIDRLGGLDIGFTGEGEQTDTLNGFPDATNGAVAPAPNTPPIISGFTVVDGKAVEAGVFVGGNEANPGVPVVMGQVLASDPEGDTLTYGFINANGEKVSSITTQYGTITMGPDGTYTYTLNNEASNNLAVGENALENFTVYVSDSAGNTTVASGPIVVDVVGTNDVPTLGLTVPSIDLVEDSTSSSNPEGADTVISGVAEGADVDNGAQLRYNFGTDAEGNPILSIEDPNGYGTLNINPATGEYTYTLHNGAAQNLDGDVTFTQNVTVHVIDEHGAHSEQELVINVQGRNDAPVITATSVTELHVTEFGVKADPNNGDDPNALFDGKAADFTGQLKATDADSKDGMASDGAERPLLFSFTAADGVTITTGISPDGNPSQSITTEYGTLTLDTVTGKYSFTLNNDSAATNALNQDVNLPLSFGVTVTDAQNASNTDNVNLVVNIQGTNDRPSLSVSTSTFTVNAATQTGEGSQPAQSVEGTFTVVDQDADGGKQVFSITNKEESELTSTPNPDGTVSITTEYGVLTINPNAGDNRGGSYTYTLDNNSDVLKNLSVGESRTQTFTITTTDEHGANHSQTITITIEGGNDAPTITGSNVLNVSESGVHEGNTIFEGKVSDTGNANNAVTDVDSDGANGRTFTLTMGDGTASAGSPLYVLATANGDGTYTYTSTSTQPEGNAYIGTFNIANDGSYSFKLNNANSLVQSLTPDDTLPLGGIKVQVTDQHGAAGSGEYNLTVNIQGTNDRPQLQLFDGTGKPIGQDGMVAHMKLVEDAPNNTVQGTFTVVDVDADGTQQILSITGGKTGPDSTTGTSTPSGGGASATFTTDYGTLTVNPDGTYSYTLNNSSSAVQGLPEGHPKFETFNITTTDAHGANHTQTIIIQITGSNDRPILTPKDGNLEVTESGVITGGNNWNKGHELETDTGKVDVTDVDGDKFVFSLKVGGVEVTQGNNLYVIPVLDTNGNLTYNADGSLQFTVQTNYPGNADGSPIRLGTLKVDSEGNYSFSLDNNNKHVQGLHPGDTLKLSGIEVHVKDYTGSDNSEALDHQDITVTINGTNDRPSITVNGKDDQPIEHTIDDIVDINDAKDKQFYNDKADASGTLQVKDVDLGDSKTYSITYNGTTYTADTINDNTDGSRTIAFDTAYGKITFTIDGHGKITYEFNLDTGYGGKVHTLPEGTSANENFTLNVVDKWGASDSQNIEITINGDNDKPWVGNDQQPSWVIDQIVEDNGKEINTPQGGIGESGEGKTLDFSGTLQATDIDGDSKNLKFSFVNEGKDSAESLRTMTHTDADGNELGYITLKPDGSYTYTLFNDSPIIQALGKNDTITGTFTVRVVDANGGITYKDITITINGTNDTPLISGGSSDVFEDGGLVVPPAGADDPTVSGKVIASDVDTAEDQHTLFTGPRDANGMLLTGDHAGFTITPNYGADGQLTSTTFVGKYGTLVLHVDGSYTYTLTANDAIQGTHQDALFAKEQFPISVTTGTNHSIDHNGTTNSSGNTVDSTITITIKGTNDAPELTTEDKVQGNADHVLTTNVQNVTAATQTGLIHATDVDVDGEHKDVDSLSFHFMNKYDAQGKDIANGTFTDTTGQEKPGAPGAEHWQPEQSTNGTYGSITINPDGTYSYTLDMFSNAVKNFDGDTITETFYVTVTDHLGATNTKELVIEIPKPKYDGSGGSGGSQGNHHLEITDVTASDIGVVEDKSLTHKGQVTVDGSCCSVDGTGNHHPHTPQGEGNGHADAGSLFFAFMVDGKLTQTISDKYGSITIDPITGEYTYTLNNASTYVQELPEGYKVDSHFEVHLVNGDGSVRNETATIHTTITGTNDVPIVDRVDAINVTDEGTLVDDGNSVKAHDIDIDQSNQQQQNLTYTYTYNGETIQPGASVTTAYGTFTLNTDGTYKYVLDANSQAVNALGQGEKINDSGFKVSVSDGDSQVTKDISITINGTNDKPTLTVQNMAHGHILTEDADTAMLTGKLIGHDIDAHDKLTYSMKLAGDDGNATGNSSSYILTGKYGTMVLDPSTGEYKYMLDNERESVQKMGRTEKTTETFVFTVSDGKGGTTSQNVTITINGADDAATVTLSKDSLAVTENDSTMGNPVAFGKVDIVDRDTHDTQSLTLKHGGDTSEHIAYKGTGSTSIAGDHGTLTLNADGTYTYTLTDHSLGDGVKAVESFTIMVAEYDSNGNVIRETPHEINVNLTGSDDAATITLSQNSLAVTENDSTMGNPVAFGKVDIVDRDTHDTQSLTLKHGGGTSEHIAYKGTGSTSIAGDHGTLTLNADGTYTYTLTDHSLGDGVKAVESFTIMVAEYDSNDKVLRETPHEINVNLTGTNDAPVVTSNELQEHTLVENGNPLTATGHVTATDVDAGDKLTYFFMDANGEHVTTLNTAHGTVTINQQTGDYTYTLSNGDHLYDGQQVTESFRVYVKDEAGALASGSQEVHVNLTGINDAPVITGSETLGYDAATHTLNGHVTATDVDVLANAAHQVLTYTFAHNGVELQPDLGKTEGSVETDHGTFHFNTSDGTYSYTLNEASQGTHVTDNTFSVTASDGIDYSTNHNLSIDIAADPATPDITTQNALFSVDDDSGLFFSQSPVEQHNTETSAPNIENANSLFGADSHALGHDGAMGTPESLSIGIFAEGHTEGHTVTDDNSNLGIDTPVTYDSVFGADQNLDVYAPPADGADAAWYGTTPDASEEALQLMVTQLSQSNNG